MAKSRDSLGTKETPNTAGKKPNKGHANLIPGKGRGPKKGAPNAGRPPEWWRAKMRELRDRWLVAAEANGIVDDPNHPEWFRVGKAFHEAVDGRPAQAVDVTSDGKPLEPQRIIIAGQTIEF